MSAPTTRQELIDHCLRHLGDPVIEINVDEDQLEDRVDEAIQFWQTYHSDAVYREYLKHQITATDRTNEYITLTDDITSVSRIFPLDDTTSNNMFSAKYQLRLNDIYDLGFVGSLAHYEQTMQYLALLDMKLNGAEQIRYVRHQDRLYLDGDCDSDFQLDSYIIIECYRVVDPTANSQVFNDMFLKRYTTALIKRQWGTNLSKFEGMQLPGGVVINGRQILEEANQEIEKMEEEIQLKHELPPDMYMG